MPHETPLNYLKLRLAKFPGDLNSGTTNIPKEKCQNGLELDSLINCLVAQRVYLGGIKRYLDGKILMLVK